MGQFSIPWIHFGAGLQAGGSWPYLVRVPVTVEDDDRVGRLEVEAQPPGPRAQQEDEILGAWLIERLQQHPPVLCLRGPWNPTRASLPPSGIRARGAGGSRGWFHWEWGALSTWEGGPVKGWADFGRKIGKRGRSRSGVGQEVFQESGSQQAELRQR